MKKSVPSWVVVLAIVVVLVIVGLVYSKSNPSGKLDEKAKELWGQKLPQKTAPTPAIPQ